MNEGIETTYDNVRCDDLINSITDISENERAEMLKYVTEKSGKQFYEVYMCPNTTIFQV